MLLSFVVGFAAFTAPMGRMVQPSQGVVTSRARTPVAIGGFKMPELPNPFGGGDDFQLYPSDVEFNDVDGDNVVLRKTVGGKIDFYVNKKIKLEGARMMANGNMLAHPQLLSNRLVALHFNWIVGSDEKRKCMKKNRFWLLQENARRRICTKGRITFSKETDADADRTGRITC